MDWHHHQGEQEESGKPALQVAWTLVWAPPASRYARCQLPPGAARGHCYVPGGQVRGPMQLSPSWAGAATAMSLLIPPPPSGLPSCLLKHWVGLQLRRLATSSRPCITGRTTSISRSTSGSLLPT